MVEPSNAHLSITVQCRLLSISRASWYYDPKGETPFNLKLMGLMGLCAIYQEPRMSQPHPQHRIYPYLLRNLAVTQANQVWCTDMTYIPIKRGFLYLVAIMDWYSRTVLSWRVSNTMDTHFCVKALEEALALHGAPEIFNTDQGAQFTSWDFTAVLKAHGLTISMDGKGRWMDNVFIERL